MENDSANFTQNHIMGFQDFLERKMDNPEDVQRLMTAYKPEDLQEVKELYGDYIQTEAFKDISNINSSSSDYQGQYDTDKQSNLVPAFNKEQEGVMKVAGMVTKGKAEMMSDEERVNRESWELFNQDAYKGISEASQQQQTKTEATTSQSIENNVDLSLKDTVEQEVGDMRTSKPSIIETEDIQRGEVSYDSTGYWPIPEGTQIASDGGGESTNQNKGTVNSDGRVSLASDPNHG